MHLSDLTRLSVSCRCLWCTISGAGPTCVAVTDGKEQGERIAEAMVQAFRESGPLEVNSARVVKLDHAGAKSV